MYRKIAVKLINIFGMNKITPLVLGAALLLAFTGSNLTITDFEASLSEENSNEIIVTWMAENEGDIEEYELHRKMPQDSEFRFIDTKDLQPGMGNIVEYEYHDRAVFKSQTKGEQVVYRLKARLNNGQVNVVGQTDIHYTSSGVRRTWGSIKKMFQ